MAVAVESADKDASAEDVDAGGVEETVNLRCSDRHAKVKTGHNSICDNFPLPFSNLVQEAHADLGQGKTNRAITDDSLAGDNPVVLPAGSGETTENAMDHREEVTMEVRSNKCHLYEATKR